jgi:alkylated DNA repair dioxygenase AlkB
MVRHYMNDCDYVEHEMEVIEVNSEMFEELWKIWDIIPFTPNPMNKQTNIKRKQGTFGVSYAFGGQKSKEIEILEDKWPKIVKKVLEDVSERSESERYKVVHMNLYPDGSSGIAPHADNESIMVEGMAIYSYTFLSEPGNPRGFQVYEKKSGEQLYDLKLDHSDLVIMSGGMQRNYLHGVKSTTAKKFKNQRRINLTVRACQ